MLSGNPWITLKAVTERILPNIDFQMNDLMAYTQVVFVGLCSKRADMYLEGLNRVDLLDFNSGDL